MLNNFQIFLAIAVNIYRLIPTNFGIEIKADPNSPNTCNFILFPHKDYFGFGVMMIGLSITPILIISHFFGGLKEHKILFVSINSVFAFYLFMHLMYTENWKLRVTSLIFWTNLYTKSQTIKILCNNAWWLKAFKSNSGYLQMTWLQYCFSCNIDSSFAIFLTTIIILTYMNYI